MEGIPVLAMIARSGWVARTILIVLAFESIIVWAVIIDRLVQLGRGAKLNRFFRRAFGKVTNIAELERLEKKFEHSALGKLGQASALEYRRILADAKSHTGVKDWSFFLQNQFAMTGERLEASVSELSARLHRGTFLLALIGSSAPFLGLLGTVWGIMDSFYEIGQQGSASLPVVAPGIAEALITTIVGLIVAIPASFFYNYVVHRANRIEDEMDEFKEVLSSRVRREVLSLLFGERAQRAGQA